MNPAEWLFRTARRSPEAAALFSGTNYRLDYGDFDQMAASLGASLKTRGIGKGSRVGVFMSNRIEYLIALYGIWYCGAVAVPINAKLHVTEAIWILRDSEAEICFASLDVGADLQREIGETISVVCVEDDDFARMSSTIPLDAPETLDSSDLAWLFYTSGTTGQPKGVMMTAGNIQAMTLSYMVDVDEVTSADAILYAAPMSHGAGLYNFMHVIRAARHVIPEGKGFDPEEILKLAPEIGSISMFAAPTMVRRLVEVARTKGLSGDGIKTIVYAGGPMYFADIVDAVNVLGDKFVQIYGLGECPMGISVLSRQDVTDREHPNWQDRLRSVGVAQTVSRIKIVDPGGKEVPVGETGEIAVRGDAVMAGYWKNPEATAQAIKDGWLWTGDMGRMDEEGYLTLQDRSKDMIISGGSNIYPREVEDVLLQDPAVSEVAVVGRPHPEWGEEVVAFVVCHAGETTSEAHLDQLCLSHIARFKRPKTYRFVTTLPKNNYGKVVKTTLREQLSDDL